jgi:hypothetical protein
MTTGLRQCPQARKGNPTFPLSHFCLCSYVLHTLKYCTSSTGKILMFRLSHPRNQSWNLAGYRSNGHSNYFLLSFSFLGFFFLLQYLVPTYIRYLRRKTVVWNENRPIRGGYDFHTEFKHTCATQNFQVAPSGRRSVRKSDFERQNKW